MNRTLLALLTFLCFCCKDEGTPPPPDVPSIALEAVDASCTEAWLRASTTATPATVRLLRDNQRVADLRILTADSLLIDGDLLPNRQYSYQLQKLGNDSNVVEISTSVQLTTMDTTSHYYTWQLDTLGDGSSSVLADVAIINDTLAYAVGAIYLRDSVGNWDPNAYNMVKWNGNRWELMRVQFYTFCNQPSTGSYPAKSIFAFSPTDVWIGMDGSQVVHWNGQTQSAPMCTPVSINKLWGDNPNSVWAVGNNGGIAHYNGSTWQRVESGVTANMQDVWGYTNQSGATTILAVASPSPETEILSISSSGVRDTLSWFPNYPLSSTWMSSTPAVYVASQGIWRNKGFGWHGMVGPSNTFYTGIRGSCENNVAAVGWGGVLSHFNGISWRTYTQIPSDFFFEAVAVSEDMIVAVGYTVNGVFADKAAVVIGRRVR